MRINKGSLKGTKISGRVAEHVRPTTALSRKGIMSVLENLIDWPNAHCLDLFAGTGVMSLEFVSAGSRNITLVEMHAENARRLKQIKPEIPDISWQVAQADAVKYIAAAVPSWNLIFADPPYAMPGIHLFAARVMENALLPGGHFVLEHQQHLRFSHPGLIETRVYGRSAFSVFLHPVHHPNP